MSPTLETGTAPTERRAKPLGDHLDVYDCPSCGHALTVNADYLTFSQPPPLECDHCGAWDMRARRFTVVPR